MTTIESRFARFRPHPTTILWGALLISLQFGLLAVYVIVTDPTVIDPISLLLPIVWITVAVLALVRTTPTPDSSRQRWIAGTLAVGYFFVLSVFGGVIGLPHPDYASGLRIAIEVPPGWGPALLYGGETVRLALIPFRVVGYVALAYLVYATIIDTAGSAIGGVIGLLSCVSCTFPVIAAVVGGTVGGVATAAATGGIQLSTVAFLVTVALLYWRPFGRE